MLPLGVKAKGRSSLRRLADALAPLTSLGPLPTNTGIKALYGRRAALSERDFRRIQLSDGGYFRILPYDL